MTACSGNVHHQRVNVSETTFWTMKPPVHRAVLPILGPVHCEWGAWTVGFSAKWAQLAQNGKIKTSFVLDSHLGFSVFYFHVWSRLQNFKSTASCKSSLILQTIPGRIYIGTP